MGNNLFICIFSVVPDVLCAPAWAEPFFIFLVMWHGLSHHKTAITAMFHSSQWPPCDFPLANAFHTSIFTDRCLFPLFHPVTLSCHGVFVSVCGCLQLKTGPADPQQERLNTNQPHKPHKPPKPHVPCRGSCHLDRQQGCGQGEEPFSSEPRAREGPLQHEAVSQTAAQRADKTHDVHTSTRVSGKYLCLSTHVPKLEGIRVVPACDEQNFEPEPQTSAASYEHMTHM